MVTEAEKMDQKEETDRKKAEAMLLRRWNMKRKLRRKNNDRRTSHEEEG